MLFLIKKICLFEKICFILYRLVMWKLWTILWGQLKASSHYGRPSWEAVGLSGQTLGESPKKWAINDRNWSLWLATVWNLQRPSPKSKPIQFVQLPSLSTLVHLISKIIHEASPMCQFFEAKNKKTWKKSQKQPWKKNHSTCSHHQIRNKKVINGINGIKRI